MSRRRRWLLLVAVACHLGLAVTGALGICLWETGAIGRVLTYYCALSGIDTKYAYFAPAVGAPSQVAFTIVDGAGNEVADRLETRVNREADIRVEDLIEVFNHRRADDALRRELAVSWAGAMFTRHPGAQTVLVDVRHRRLPTMTALQRGAESRWQSVYRARIVRARDSTASTP